MTYFQSKKYKINVRIRNRKLKSETSSKNIELKYLEWVLPNSFFKENLNIKVYEACEKIINKKLSVETIFQNFQKIEILSYAAFNKVKIEKFQENNPILLDIGRKDHQTIINPFINGVSSFSYQNNVENTRNFILLENL